MDEMMLGALRRDPDPEFGRRLWLRLQQAERQDRKAARKRLLAFDVARLRAFAVPAAAAALVIVVATVPAVRVYAASFLALFREVTFVAVSVDESRLEALGPVTVRSLLGDQVTVLQEPGPPTPVLSPEQAASLAKYPLRVPQWLPPDARIIEVAVTGEGLARVTADAARLNSLLDALGIDDVRAPDGLDGQVATIRVPRAVMIRYEHGRTRTRFFQAPTPEVTIPSGVPLQALGEIALRILGVPADDAKRFAAAIDWTSTLIVPISPKVTSVRQVTIGGTPGLAMEYVDGSFTTMVLWSSGDRVFAVVSLMGLSQVLEMANSVR